MPADILFADFHNKSKNYSKMRQDDVSGELVPVIELTPLQVQALEIVSDLTQLVADNVDVPPDYTPPRSRA